MLCTHARTAARTASERVARPSASALAVSAARAASSSRTGTTVPGPLPADDRDALWVALTGRSRPPTNDFTQGIGIALRTK